MSPNRYGDRDDGPTEATAEPAEVPHPPDCTDGWLDRDSVPARPCLVCRPHLAPSARTRLH